MKKIALLLIIAASFNACKDKKNIPDTSAIKLDLEVQRFDEDFFSIDTNAIDHTISVLNRKYPSLLQPYLQNIVGVTDSNGLKVFYRLYKPVFDSSQKTYRDFGPVKSAIGQALKLVKYYFPAYETPKTIFPVIGPMNTREDLARMANGEYTPNFIGPDFIGISLQFYLGKNFSLYTDEYFVNNVAPMYRSRRFSKEYIAADVMKLVTDDLFPDKSNTRPLVEQMIEKGKQWWLLDKFLPASPDSLKTGYTQQQLDWCKANEGLIWSYIVKNENLYSIDPFTIQTYIGEGPFTQGFSQELSPGNIGPWIGWQIVKKYESKKSGMKLDDIMKASAKQILEEAKYKPK